MGEIEPDDGRVFRGKTIEIAYFDQNRVELNPEKTLWDTLCPTGGDYVLLGDPENPKPIHVCGYLKNFLFDARIARDRVNTLSGGQQNRLMLAKVLAHPGNVLILDEPTNDLDMDTLDMLQDILADYKGTLILVSHDRDFLDNAVTEVLAFEGDALVESHLGGYSDYIAAKKPIVKKVAKETVAVPIHAPKPSSKMTFKLQHELEKLPDKIAALEKEIGMLKLVLSDADLYTRDAKAFDTTSYRLVEAQQELEKSELRWLELAEMAQLT
jgi:ATP-binding cassette subfamily F protein uup